MPKKNINIPDLENEDILVDGVFFKGNENLLRGNATLKWTKEMEEDGSTDMMAQAQQADAGVEPVDNTVDRLPTESPTPQLDAEVEKFSAGINR